MAPLRHHDATALGLGDALAAFGVGLATFLVFAPAFGLAFLSDDFSILALVRERGGLEEWGSFFHLGFFDYYRPIAFLSHALDWELWGPHPLGFHATNVALHAFNAVAVFLLARRLGSVGVSLLAAMAFVVHPTNQESVFWVAGRFDLLATAGLLSSLWLLGHGRPWAYWLGVVFFALALLSKESGIALVLMATAYDVLIARRPWQETLARLLPLAVVVAVYVTLRSVGAGLPATGGLHRAGKMAMLVVGLVGLLWMSYQAGTAVRSAIVLRRSRSWRLAVAAGLLFLGVVLFAVGSRSPLGSTIGFAWYAAYFLSPLAWVPPARWVMPGSALYLAMGTVTVVFALGLLVWGVGRWRSRPVFALAVLAASLVPVSAMPSRGHLYVGTAAAALVLATILERVRARPIVAAVGALVVAAGAAETVFASRNWQRASVMTREAVALIGADLEPCGTRDVVLLIAPGNIRGVPCNINNDAFVVSLGCAPGRLRSLLRVVDGDVTATPSISGDRLRLRVPFYRGNLVGTSDLQHFVVQFPAGRSARIETLLGPLTTWADGTTQVFEIALIAEARALPFFSYSDGTVARVELPGDGPTRQQE